MNPIISVLTKTCRKVLKSTRSSGLDSFPMSAIGASSLSEEEPSLETRKARFTLFAYANLYKSLGIQDPACVMHYLYSSVKLIA